jgi:murein DD-endopeptidase MepM/ murein hydrolase activator NlpD
MVKATHLEQVGNSFKVYYEDGSKAQAYPTQGSIWLVSLASSGGGGGTGDFSQPYSDDYVTSEYGPRGSRFHEGRDWSGGPAVTGQPIPCVGDGTVHNVFFNSGYGNCADIFHGTFDGWDWYSRYGHMNTAPVVSEGATVTKGQTLGPIGNTGNSFGAHLHLEIHRVTPGGDLVSDPANPSWSSSRTTINPVDFFNAYGDGGVLIP